ncbi:MAG: hypothetical protein C0445_09785 [Polaromonas sp.]|nr:hypothetical protein [Polaromonas sp.]
MFFPAIVGLLGLVGVMVFFWVHNGPGSGRPFGNRVAAHIGMPKSVFYALLENGVEGSSRELLASLQRSKLGLEEAGVKLGPTLGKGLARLERRFGAQGIYDRARPIVARLVAAAEKQ